MSAPTDLRPLAPGDIRFHQAAPPPLPPGDYKLTVTQDLEGADDAHAAKRKNIRQQFSTEAPFTLAGPRFYLKPTEVYSVYPPAGHFGPFDNSLPHIVFTRRTLPWERTIDGERQDPDAPVPWMALLLLGRTDFDGEEGKAKGQLPRVTARTVAQLLRPGGTIQGPQGLELEGGQSEKDLCNTIDLPKAVFAEVVPAAEDLPFLAHVREVKTGGKETLSLKQDGWFTVVLGNRFPATTEADEGEMNLACLVSLEGFAGLLPTVDDATEKATVPFDKSRVRLAVLASWKFTCYGHNDFKTRMKRLDDGSLLALPQDGLSGGDPGTAAVRNAFTLGYAGLNHTTRLGEKTVSWYRGPLVPLQMDPLSPYAFLPCADRALRYDYRSGLFAAEYAAAFELGRMLALQNRGFASAMYRFRNRVWRETRAEAMRTALDGELGVPAELRGRRYSSEDAVPAELQGRRESFEDTVAALFVRTGGLT